MGQERGGSPSVFSNKSKLKLKPIKDSSVGILSRALEPAGNELLAARATQQGDKTSFSASSAGRWHWLRSLSPLWVGVAPRGGGTELATEPCPGLVSPLLVPSMLFTSDDGQGLVRKRMMLSKSQACAPYPVMLCSLQASCCTPSLLRSPCPCAWGHRQ